MRTYKQKIVTLRKMLEKRNALKKKGRKLVFTNGCFDLLHAGHADYLSFARKQGDALVVAINSDKSTKRAKGPSRPIVSQRDRARVIASLECVDYVLIFNDDEPARIIAKISPDVLVKGKDWKHYVSGREHVEKTGGRVVLAPMVKGLSTSNIMRKIQALPRERN